MTLMPRFIPEDVLETIQNYDRILASDDEGTEYDLLAEMLRNFHPSENPVVLIFKCISGQE